VGGGGAGGRAADTNSRTMESIIHISYVTYVWLTTESTAYLWLLTKLNCSLRPRHIGTQSPQDA
jgi:hypothetical protein